MAALLSLILVMTLSGPVGAAPAHLFAPQGCEYSVSFPKPPLGLTAVETGGRRISKAEVNAAGTVLRASCTIGYEEGSLDAVSDNQLLAFVGGLVGRMGIGDARLRLGRAEQGRFVAVSGALPQGGEMFHIESRFYYGYRSRLIVEAISRGDFAAGDRATRFFASVAAAGR